MRYYRVLPTCVHVQSHIARIWKISKFSPLNFQHFPPIPISNVPFKRARVPGDVAEISCKIGQFKRDSQRKVRIFTICYIGIENTKLMTTFFLSYESNSKHALIFNDSNQLNNMLQTLQTNFLLYSI